MTHAFASWVHILRKYPSEHRARGAGGAALSFEDGGDGFSRPQPVAPPRRRRSWLTSGGGTPSLSAERGGDSHAGTSGSVSEGSEGAPAVPPPKKRRRHGGDASIAMLESRLDKQLGQKQQLNRAAGPQSGSAAFDGLTRVDAAGQLSMDGDVALPRSLPSGLFPDAVGIGKRQASLSGWLPDRECPCSLRCSQCVGSHLGPGHTADDVLPLYVRETTCHTCMLPTTAKPPQPSRSPVRPEAFFHMMQSPLRSAAVCHHPCLIIAVRPKCAAVGQNPCILIAVRTKFAEAPLDLAVAAPPPAAGFDERDSTVCARWMARVAMHLDDALDARAAAYEDAASPGGGGARSPSCAPSEAGGRCGFSRSPHWIRPAMLAFIVDLA